jgi:hypothetical protein
MSDFATRERGVATITKAMSEIPTVLRSPLNCTDGSALGLIILGKTTQNAHAAKISPSRQKATWSRAGGRDETTNARPRDQTTTTRTDEIATAQYPRLCTKRVYNPELRIGAHRLARVPRVS